MRSFFWRKTNVARGDAWTTVCRPVAHGGLGVCHLQHTNTTVRRMGTPLTGACGRPHTEETPSWWWASEGFSHLFGLSLDRSWDMGHSSIFGRMIGLGWDAWVTLSPASTP